ncbi:glycerate kinase [Lutibacter sp.]|uniref:glycerate kinase n=1 Tax=Lutibacter sp. TaxID=1925666 RepID=UPI0025BBB91A|nr:glycerate kinase [Lutibacter sp.]MCF6181358.1 glycerate kinase [Lutibacter sp.]
MKVIIAPDKFKGSLTAIEVCNAVEKGIKKADPSIEVIKHPIADGGEGTLDILDYYFKLKTIDVKVHNPLFKIIYSNYKVSKDVAYIEMSKASGLQLLSKKEQNCFYTSSFGTGELILAAIEKGFKNIVLFIGGSATNDAGIGMACALGYSFYNKQGIKIKPIGKELININKIDSKNLKFDLNKINFTVIYDVKNPLYGNNGAAFMYASQKGASKNEIEILNSGLINFDSQIKAHFGKYVAYIKGSGAAGGLGAGAVSFLNAKMVSGIDFILEKTNFKKYFKDKIDLIITGEGSVDKQTLEGKVVKGVSDLSKQYKVPIYIVAGIIKDKESILKNINPLAMSEVMEVNITTKEAIKNAAIYIEDLVYSTFKTLKKAN